MPLAGIEPALLAELDFESSASTSSATGARAKRSPRDIERRRARGQRPPADRIQEILILARYAGAMDSAAAGAYGSARRGDGFQVGMFKSLYRKIIALSESVVSLGMGPR